jgi:hypothetical protein
MDVGCVPGEHLREGPWSRRGGLREVACPTIDEMLVRDPKKTRPSFQPQGSASSTDACPHGQEG